MRYMWVCNRFLSWGYVRRCLTGNGEGFVTREITFSDLRGWVFIGDMRAYNWANANELTDEDSDYWSITSCNKQYVTNIVTGKYVGALGEVDLDEAKQWLKEYKNNWYLADPDTDQIWIPLDRNPNKIIPTGDAGYCRHCGNTNAQTPGNRYHPVYRPWPLHVDA